MEWLADGNYMQSVQGFSASVKIVVRLVELLGASYRVIKPRGAGATPYVWCTLGHFALVCAVLRGVFAKIAGIKAVRRCGLAGGIFQEFKAGVAIADAFLPKHDRPENGMLLIDGHDPGRELLGDEDEHGGPSREEAEMDDEELEEEELSMDDLDMGESADGALV